MTRVPIGGTTFRQFHETFDMGDGIRMLELMLLYKDQNEESGEFDRVLITYTVGGVNLECSVPFDVFDTVRIV